MKEAVYVDVGAGKQMSVEVEPLGTAARARFLAMFPGDSDRMAVDASDMDVLEWHVEVAEWTTSFSEDAIMSLGTHQLIPFLEAVIPAAFDIDDLGESSGPTTVPTDEWMVVR